MVAGKGHTSSVPAHHQHSEQLLHYNSVNSASGGGPPERQDLSGSGSSSSHHHRNAAGELVVNNFRPGSQGNQRARPNVSAENARRKVKDQIIESGGAHEQVIMGRTAHDAFPNTKSAPSQKLYSSQKHLQAFSKAQEDRRH